MKLSALRIRNLVTSDIYQRGERAYRERRVRLISIDNDRFDAEVTGKMVYHVSVQEIGGNIYSSCTCPYWTTCKHVVAALLTAKEWYDENGAELQRSRTRPYWKKFLKQVIDIDADAPPAKEGPQWRVIYLLHLNQESWSLTPQKAYIKKNNLLGRFSNIGDLDPDSRELLYAPNDPIVVSHLQKIEYQSKASYYSLYFGSGAAARFKPGVYHYKYGSRLGPLFDLLRESVIFLSPYEEQTAPLSFEPLPATVELEFEREEGGYRLAPRVRFGDAVEPLDESYRVLTGHPIWLIKEKRLIKVQNMEDAALLVPFTKNGMALTIPDEEFPLFLQNAFHALREIAPVSLPSSLVTEYRDRLTGAKLKLCESERHLEVKLRFVYEDVEIDGDEPWPICYRQKDDRIVEIRRDLEAEAEHGRRLLESGLKRESPGSFRILDTKALNWMFAAMPRLQTEGYVFEGREELRRFRVRTGEPNVRVAVTSGIDWFDVNIEIDVEGVPLPLKELRRAVRRNSRLVRLADQSLAQLSDEWFDKFQHLFHLTAPQENGVRASGVHLSMIDMLFHEAAVFETDDQFDEKLAALTRFQGIEPQPLPPSLVGVMRNYQKAGYDWLNFLQRFGFGGCLADDMGLGKTVQTLALLLKDKQQGNRTPSLIVCPTSVVFNWEKEVQKFTPELRVLQHTGSARARTTDVFDGYDIVLTSYGVLRRDIAMLKDFEFHYVILDESQKIKNPLSQTAKAARLLKARYRLVLTGTPVENNTVELWSQFAFLNPALLGPISYFRSAFTVPIEKHGDEEARNFLRRLVFPFILRRTKENVERELPPKVEQTFLCAMSPEQEAVYVRWRDYYRALILDRIDEAGLAGAHMNVLEGLVKLRQIACHPRLIDKSITEDSGKFEALKELIEEILAENHKVLVFSQFVRMLRLIRAYLDEGGISFEYLDGHTTDRMARVERFQNDRQTRIFLISLKAGGVGLNLTAADYVILFDPWWNPAVEVQATDRAHRIGQDKKVFVYRLITKGSVEEKMLELQARKRRLVSDLIAADSAFFKSLTREDIEILFS